MLNPDRLELLRTFRLDRTYVRGEGTLLWDDGGRRVLDATSQYGALPFGHNPAPMWEALLAAREQGLPALVQPSRPLLAERLAERLAAVAPVRGEAVVTFCQSGSEAVEAAVRLARLATGRQGLVAAERGYHGQTAAARSLTTDADPDVRHVPFGDVDSLRAALATGDVAALVLEPVQGEGGVHVAPPGYLAAARRLCDEHGALLVVDEVQTGLGRTGARFALDAEAVEADVLLLAKALGGGLVPLAACVASRACVTETFSLSHGSTFANNNLTCSVGLAVLDALTDDLLAEARAKGERFGARLADLAERFPGGARAVRGRGLMWGVELAPVGAESSFILADLTARGALVGACAAYLLHVHGVRVIPSLGKSPVLRLLPPLTASDAELDAILDAVEDLVRTLHFQDWAVLLSPLIDHPAGMPWDCRALARPIVSSAPATARETPTRFAFLLHPTGPDDLLASTPALRSLPPEALRRLYRWCARHGGHAPVCFMPAVRSPAGGLAEGWLISVAAGAEELAARPRHAASAEVARAVHTGVALGAQVIGLGAFTSIATANGRDLLDTPAALTTGNALTTAIATLGVETAACELGRDLCESRGLVLGLGVVGSAVAHLAGDLLGALTLVGRPDPGHRRRPRGARRARGLADRVCARAARRMATGDRGGLADTLAGLLALLPMLERRGERLAERLLDPSADSDGLSAELAWAARSLGHPIPVDVSFDLPTALAECDVVFAATSAPHAPIQPQHLRPGAIVCDVAKPSDVDPSVLRERPDVFVFDGGLASYPEPIAFGQNLGHAPGVNLACLTETVLLALEGVTSGHHGVFPRRLPDEVTRVAALARRHGFGLAALRRGGRVLGPADLQPARVVPAVSPLTRTHAA